jgi:hypothetical protein
VPNESCVAARNTTGTNWAGNAMTSVNVFWDPDNLYIRVIGSVQALNAIVGYLDFDDTQGVANGNTLTDNSPDLDNAISCNYQVQTGSGPELAFGVAGMVSDGDHLGWRDLTPTNDFPWLVGPAPPFSLVPATPTEFITSIDRNRVAAIVGLDPLTVRLFLRLVSIANPAAFSNQTLPMDDTANPQNVNNQLEFVWD